MLFVVSPLKSDMKDQIEEMEELGVPSTALSTKDDNRRRASVDWRCEIRTYFFLVKRKTFMSRLIVSH